MLFRQMEARAIAGVALDGHPDSETRMRLVVVENSVPDHSIHRVRRLRSAEIPGHLSVGIEIAEPLRSSGVKRRNSNRGVSSQWITSSRDC